MSKRLVVANWKMHVSTPQHAVALAKAVRKQATRMKDLDVVLAPAFPLIAPAAAALKGSAVRVGAQTVSEYSDAKHTGEVSAAMLASCGVSAVIVGHSDRRGAAPAEGESDASIREQIQQASRAKLRVILCVGERQRDHAGGHFEIIASQLRAALRGAALAPAKLVVAYEPVWAIGKSAADAMQPAEVQETVIFIRKILADELGRAAAVRVPVLYGGSVEPMNARALILEGGVSGFLVGHASADADSFTEILKACAK